MQPAVSVASEVFVVAGPRWLTIIAALLVALAVTALAGRMAVAPVLGRGRRWVQVVAVLSWALALTLAGLRLLAVATPLEFAARAALLSLLAIVAAPVLRDVLAGVALAIEGRVRFGDDVRVGAHEGRVVGLGLRSLVLRTREGTEISLGYRSLIAGEFVRLDLGGRGSACSFEVEVASDALEATALRLFESAILSPYAAPGRRPEVVPVADVHGRVRLRVRAFVFDRAYEEQYRGDLLARAGLVGTTMRATP